MKAAALGHQYFSVKSVDNNGYRFGSSRFTTDKKKNSQFHQTDYQTLPSVSTERSVEQQNSQNVTLPTEINPNAITTVEPTSASVVHQAESMMEVELEAFEKKEESYSLASIMPKRQGILKGRKLPLRVRRFYRRQDSLIDSFVQLQNEASGNVQPNTEKLNEEKRYTDWLVKLTVVINCSLLAAKIVAAVFSRSLSIISAVVDSAVDSASACLLLWAVWAIKNRNPYNYPGGRTRLEPIIVVILSVAMVSASVQVIYESTESLINDIEYFKNNSTELRQVTMGPVPITIMSLTIVIKTIMALSCFQIKNPIMQALGHDHFNDVAANAVALVCGLVAAAAIGGSIKPTEVALIDPIGAILVSLYIIFSWGRQLRNQVRNLSGYKAEPEFIQKITWLTLNHSPFIRQVDNVRAFHFGTSFLVEIELVLPESMSLREAHGLGQSLKEKLEKLPEIELAFVHLDYSGAPAEY